MTFFLPSVAPDADQATEALTTWLDSLGAERSRARSARGDDRARPRPARPVHPGRPDPARRDDPAHLGARPAERDQGSSADMPRLGTRRHRLPRDGDHLPRRGHLPPPRRGRVLGGRHSRLPRRRPIRRRAAARPTHPRAARSDRFAARPPRRDGVPHRRLAPEGDARAVREHGDQPVGVGVAPSGRRTGPRPVASAPRRTDRTRAGRSRRAWRGRVAGRPRARRRDAAAVHRGLREATAGAPCSRAPGPSASRLSGPS